MDKRKTGFVAVVLGALAVRSLRKRWRADDEATSSAMETIEDADATGAEEAVEETIGDSLGETETAVEHASAAVEHAQAAIRAAIEAVREETEQLESAGDIEVAPGER